MKKFLANLPPSAIFRLLAASKQPSGDGPDSEAALKTKKHVMSTKSAQPIAPVQPPVDAAPDAAPSPAEPKLATQDAVRASIAKSAEVLGCQKSGNISGSQFLLIFLRALRDAEVLPSGPISPVAVSVIEHFDANNSAMRQRLEKSWGATGKPATLYDKLAAGLE